MKRFSLLAIVLALVTLSFSLGAASPAVDVAFEQFWDAGSPASAAKAVDAIVRSGVSFDEAFARFRRGRTYDSDVPRGVVRFARRVDGEDFPYTLDVPEHYDPAKAYQVRVQLHGGVSRPDNTPRGNGIGALGGAEQIYILPTAWLSAEWWTSRQLENLSVILDRVKRTYNVDENRVVLSGVSDGGTGTYYVGMRDTTPYASFLPLNGAVAVLQSPSIGLEGHLFPNNFLNKPFFIVNGGRDPLYPTDLVEPYIEHMAKNGVAITYLPQPNAAHNTAWWPDVKDRYEAFVREHPRQPLPETLTWESDLSPGTSRAHWLVIDALAPERADAPPLKDLNDDVLEGVPNVSRARVVEWFPRRTPSGRVDLSRNGNTVTATTRGVGAFTLLLSPDAFDFSRPVKVVADGRTLFEGPVTKSVATLATWAARDNDRTLLFGAEVKVKLTE